MYYIKDPEQPSYDKHRTYKIKKGDTLQSVAQELGIDARELRGYHNSYCPIADLIEADFKRHLELLILAPKKNQGEANDTIEKEPRKVKFGKDYKLHFLPQGTKKEYRVDYIFETGGKTDSMSMGVRVKWLATDKNGFHLLEIYRAPNIYIDEKEPDTKMDKLGAKVSEIIYPLQIVVDASGKWLEIHNYNEIVNRWKNAKNEILEYYDGGIAENYINDTQYALESSNALLESLSSDYFLRAFFNGIHVAYSPDYTFENEVSFPLEKNKESLFKVEQKIATYLDESNLIKIEQQGNYVDSSFETNLGYEPWQGNYKAIYFLKSDSYCIEKMNLECSIEYDNPVKIGMTIEIIKKEEIQSKG